MTDPNRVARLLAETPDEAKKRICWNRLRPILGLPADEWRQDAYGNRVRRKDYGDRSSPYGWELDHHPIPKSRGGLDNVSNLRALHFRPNAQHGAALGLGLRSFHAELKAAGITERPKMGYLYGLAAAGIGPFRDLT